MDLELLLDTVCTPLTLSKGEEDANGCKWVQVAVAGDYVKSIGGENVAFTLSTKVFREIVSNFERRPEVQRRLRWDFEHASEPGRAPDSFASTGVPAQGWIHALKIEGDGLWALTKWLEPAKTLIKEEKYQYCSPAIRLNPADNQGVRRGAVMSSVALTNDPFLDRLPAIAATNHDPLKGTRTMTPEEIAALKLELQNAKLKISEQATQIADVGLQLKDSDAKTSKVQKDYDALLKKHDDFVLTMTKARVDEAFATYGEDRKLTDEDREAMGLLLTASPEKFEKRYPRLSADKAALLHRQVTKAGPAVGSDPNFALKASGESEDKSNLKELLALSFEDHVKRVRQAEKCSFNEAVDRVLATRELAEQSA